ncbi:Vacuolar protein sorting-associated protein 53 A, partial [Zea mays]
MQAFQRTIEFEEELAEEFSGGTTNARNKETTSDDEDEGGGHNKIVSDIRKKYEKKLAAPNDEDKDKQKDLSVPGAGFNLHGIISSCCEPYMIVYIELEEKALVDQLEKLVQ